MSVWSDRVEASDARTAIEAVSERAGRLPTSDDPEELESQQRFRAVAAHLAQRIRATDPDLVPPRTLASAMPHLTNIVTAATAYVDTSDATQLAAAHEAIDQLLSSSYFWVHETDAEIDLAREAATSYRRSVGQLIRNLEAERDVLANSLSALRSDVESVPAAAEAKAAEAAAAIDSALAPMQARIDAAEQTIVDQKSRLDTAISAFQDQFSKAEASRTETFTQAVARLTEAHASFMREQEASGAAAGEDLKSQAATVLDSIKQHEQQAREVLGALGREGITGGHVKYANEQRVMSIIWSAVAVLALIAIAAYGVWSLAERPAGIDWQWVGARVLVAGSVLLLAVFAMVQTGRYREAEHRSRQTELDLAALDPYMALLPEAEQQKLKIELAQRAFFQPVEQAPKGQSVGVKDLLDLLREAIKK
ncbi:MAG: hypothetical protein WEG56_07485 [Chloroflexota bacterium]